MPVRAKEGRNAETMAMTVGRRWVVLQKRLLVAEHCNQRILRIVPFSPHVEMVHLQCLYLPHSYPGSCASCKRRGTLIGHDTLMPSAALI